MARPFSSHLEGKLEPDHEPVVDKPRSVVVRLRRLHRVRKEARSSHRNDSWCHNQTTSLCLSGGSLPRLKPHDSHWRVYFPPAPGTLTMVFLPHFGQRNLSVIYSVTDWNHPMKAWRCGSRSEERYRASHSSPTAWFSMRSGIAEL